MRIFKRGLFEARAQRQDDRLNGQGPGPCSNGKSNPR